ncbi:MAG: serine/threonine-protein kinase [Acidobacteria bacterium]|nr:serine/threonine-protein kinase [Acidobacteriota bacterium]
MIGQTLSHYRVTAALGAGGMGEVYRATDTKLGREVAIKVLPSEVAQDAERLARFEREARLLASLNHPNVAVIHGLEKADGKPFLVLELVEGEELKQRLARGAVPADEAMEIARQIAEGLEEAHERGIIHRDLKPANVKLTPDGKVKVLDFGLAKAWTADPTLDSSDGLSQSPTLAHTGTEAGVILGTAAYMAPEQARGRAVDRRADIWAFGVVVFEMLTGRALFRGDTVTDVLAAVVREDVDWSRLPAETPAGVRQLLRRCLDRDPRRRLQAIGEARVLLSSAPAMLGPESEPSAATGGPRTGSGARIVAGAAAAAALFAAGWLLKPAPPREPESTEVRYLPLPSEGRTIRDDQALSPDGGRIAYTAEGRLWVRDLDQLVPREVEGSDGAESPFWSPDSENVAFRAGEGLFRVRAGGGRPRKLADLPRGDFGGGTWGPRGTLVVAVVTGGWTGRALQVPAEGGEVRPFLEPDKDAGEYYFASPRFLPGGEALLLTVMKRSAADVLVLVDGAKRTLLETDAYRIPAIAWSPSGHLLYERESRRQTSLWSAPFSAETLTITGRPALVADRAGGPSVSEDGTVLFASRSPEPWRLAWVDRQGAVLGHLGPPFASMTDPALSPDGDRVAVCLVENSVSDVWVLDAASGERTRLTFDLDALRPAWSPEGDRVAYSNIGTGNIDVTSARGGAPSQPLVASEIGIFAPDWSRDRRHLLYYALAPETQRDLWVMELGEGATPRPLLRTPANEALPKLSPTGRYVAYQSDETGRWEIRVRPFPEGEGQWQVSVNGGERPTWSRRGDELFYVEGNTLMAVPIRTAGGFEAGAPRALFSGDQLGTELNPPLNGFTDYYDVGVDGQRFLVVQGIGRGPSQLVLVEGLQLGAPGDDDDEERTP